MRPVTIKVHPTSAMTSEDELLVALMVALGGRGLKYEVIKDSAKRKLAGGCGGNCTCKHDGPGIDEAPEDA